MDYSFVYIIHILFAGPLLLYAGHIGKELSKKCKDNTNDLLFNVLMGVGILVVLYYGYKYMSLKKMINSK